MHTSYRIYCRLHDVRAVTRFSAAAAAKNKRRTSTSDISASVAGARRCLPSSPATEGADEATPAKAEAGLTRA